MQLIDNIMLLIVYLAILSFIIGILLIFINLFMNISKKSRNIIPTYKLYKLSIIFIAIPFVLIFIYLVLMLFV